MNDQIRISPVRLIAADGEQRGIVPLDQAKEEAREAGLDLVEVAPTARPPVVRVMDWGKHQYDQAKRAKESRRRQHTVDTKALRFRPQTGEHDLEFKLRRARRFLKSGKKVQITVRYRGRELRQPEPGFQLLDRVAEELDDVAEVEGRSNRIEGRHLQMMLVPK